MGEHRCALDEKGRLNFPARFREEMGESFIVTRWLEKCLIALPDREWQRMARLLTEKGMAANRDAQRKIFSGAGPVAPDKQGRILITGSLRQHAGLEKEVVVIGVGDHAEIWDAETWERLRDSDDGDMAAMLEEMGV